MTDPTDLKPCPFCGAEADTDQPGPMVYEDGFAEMCGVAYWGVHCLRCEIHFVEYATEAEVIAAWNRRADDTALQAAERRGLERAAEVNEGRARHARHKASDAGALLKAALTLIAENLEEAAAAIRALTQQGGDGNGE